MPLQTLIRFPFHKQNIIHHTQFWLLKSVLINSLLWLWSWQNKKEILKLPKTLVTHVLNFILWLSTILIAFNAVLFCTLIKLIYIDGYFIETYKTKTFETRHHNYSSVQLKIYSYVSDFSLQQVTDNPPKLCHNTSIAEKYINNTEFWN